MRGESLGFLVGEVVGGDSVHRDFFVGFGDEGVGEGVAAADYFVAGDFYEVDGFGVAGLEADGGAGGDVEALAVGGGAVEFQGSVGFDEVVMAADLDGAVAE